MDVAVGVGNFMRAFVALPLVHDVPLAIVGSVRTDHNCVPLHADINTSLKGC